MLELESRVVRGAGARGPATLAGRFMPESMPGRAVEAPRRVDSVRSEECIMK